MRTGAARSVAIIGGGVAGLATARGLLDAGWQVQVYDRGEPEPRLDTAFGLWPSAWSVLRRCGAAEALEAVAERPTGGALLDPSGRVLVDPRRTPDVRLVPRPAVLDALRSSLPAEVVVRTEVTAAELPPADLLVGADGIRSLVRSRISAVEPRAIGSVAWRGTLPGSPSVPAETWGDGLLFGVTPGGAGRTNWFACARTERAGEGRVDPTQRLRQLFGGWHRGVTDVLDRLPGGRIDRRRLMEAPRLRSLVDIRDGARTVLVGDAAHAMAPNLGRGACEGLLDAAALADAVITEPDLATALRRYDRRRRVRSGLVRTGSRWVNRLSTAERGWQLRNHAFAVLGRLA